MSDSGDGWQVACRRKGASRTGKLSHSGCQKLQHTETLDIERTKKRITETMSELRCTDLWQEWKGILSGAEFSQAGRDPTLEAPYAPGSISEGDRDDRTKLEECVCYGLGSFSSCVSARYQLAMLLLLLDTLKLPLQACCVYDPVFSSGETDVLRELGFSVLIENEEGKRPVTKPTLFYLMHCGKALYNNMLWKNWTMESLPLLTIVGNSFSGIQERMVERELQRDYSYIAHAVGVACERLLPCSSRLLDVFNDTALITFPAGGLGKLPQSTWVEPSEPLYLHCADLEIIQREVQR